jgi:hypothetical protein
MTRYLVLAAAAVVLAMTAPAAFATRVIFDPPPNSLSSSALPSTDCTQSMDDLNNYTPCRVTQLNTPYTVEWVDCSSLSPGLMASGWCLFMDNVTGGSLSSFRFEFNVPSGGSSDGSDLLECSSQGIRGPVSDNCPDGARLSPGDSLDLSFFTLLPNNTNFYLITDFINQPDPATVTVSAPEPGELGLFCLGLLMLAGYGWRRRRQYA